MIVRAFLVLLLLASPAFAQSPGTVNLVGPSTSPGAPQITPAAVNTAVNVALTAKADVLSTPVTVNGASCAAATSLPVARSTVTAATAFGYAIMPAALPVNTNIQVTNGSNSVINVCPRTGAQFALYGANNPVQINPGSTGTFSCATTIQCTAQ